MAEVSLEKQRKKRKLNFTVSETNILTRKVEENLDVLQSKFTNSVTNQRKKQDLRRYNKGDKCGRSGEQDVARS